jgi:hypothetical protein
MATSLPFLSVCRLSVWQVEFCLYLHAGFSGVEPITTTAKRLGHLCYSCFMYEMVHHNNSIFSSKIHNTLNNQTYLVEIVIHCSMSINLIKFYQYLTQFLCQLSICKLCLLYLRTGTYKGTYVYIIPVNI